ncbi:MAG: hypothetical protein ACREXS_16445 [Gammaproteobacteria bacterium]
MKNKSIIARLRWLLILTWCVLLVPISDKSYGAEKIHDLTNNPDYDVFSVTVSEGDIAVYPKLECTFKKYHGEGCGLAEMVGYFTCHLAERGEGGSGRDPLIIARTVDDIPQIKTALTGKSVRLKAIGPALDGSLCFSLHKE